MIAIPRILTDKELATVKEALKDAEFVDGKVTAGFRAKRVKHNQQLDKDVAGREELERIIVNALERSRTFQMAVIPKRIHRPLFGRYKRGMKYGVHVDDALMNHPSTIRTDLAITVFLSDPADYGGGELVVRSQLGEQMVKLSEGDAVVYAASTLHRVAPVTRGERLVAITWAQSFVRDPLQRDVIFDIDRVRRSMHKVSPDSEEADLADKVYANLLRMWSDV